MTKKIIITVLSILLFAGVVVGGYFGYKKLSEKNPPDAGTLGTEQKGDYKDFTVTDVNGKEVKLSDFIGQAHSHKLLGVVVRPLQERIARFR